jgi:hypothetical protein
MEEGFEPVYSVEDYYDGPRTGTAEFRGVLHRYTSLGWESPDGPTTADWDPRDDRYVLVPVTGPSQGRLVVRGEFELRHPVPDLPPGVLRPLKVRWTTVGTAGS